MARLAVVYAATVAVVLAALVESRVTASPVPPMPPPQATAAQAAPTTVAARQRAEQEAKSEAEPTTVVSLTFDDGTPDHFAVGQLLATRGLRATFYVNSGLVDGTGGTMSWPQIAELALGGHDIGGHTLTHAKLTDPELDPAQRRREICDDRQRLTERGFPPVSFAYPYASFDSSIEDIVRSCGYGSARSGGSVSTDGPNYAERISPRDPHST
jgi:peptidoglycan/xylan/chitin deacetylase (PgdA/CDA1 family)